MENILYNDLEAGGETLSVDVWSGVCSGKSGKGSSVHVPTEIDFVVNNGSRRTHTQSAYALPDETKTRAELRPFRHIGDSFPRIIVQHDLHHRWHDEDGVLHIGLTGFLLGQAIV